MTSPTIVFDTAGGAAADDDDGVDDDQVVVRESVKAIATSGTAVLLLASSVGPTLKFPGGGTEPGEDDEAALARELAEETGHRLRHLGPLALTVIERRPATEREGAVFEMVSRYYWCEVEDQHQDLALDDYEADLGLHPSWRELGDALVAQRRAVAADPPAPWAVRELAVLEWIAANPRA